MKFCKTCGTQMDDNLRYCPKCGTSSSQEEMNNAIYDDNFGSDNNVTEIANANNQNIHNNGVNNDYAFPYNNNHKKPKKGKGVKIAIIISSALLAVVIVALSAVLFLLNSQDDKKNLGFSCKDLTEKVNDLLEENDVGFSLDEDKWEKADDLLVYQDEDYHINAQADDYEDNVTGLNVGPSTTKKGKDISDCVFMYISNSNDKEEPEEALKDLRDNKVTVIVVNGMSIKYDSVRDEYYLEPATLEDIEEYNEYVDSKTTEPTTKKKSSSSKAKEVSEPEPTTKKSKPKVTATTAPSIDESDTLLSKLKEPFTFTSGAGAWGTSLYIESDGSFSGIFSDSDMGDIGEGYSSGTRYYSEFWGKFDNVRKINDYTYAMDMSYIDYEYEVGTEEIKDNILYRYSSAYGLDEADIVYIYTPDAPTSELPEKLISWLLDVRDEKREKIGYYALYNVNEGEGFMSDNK